MSTPPTLIPDLLRGMVTTDAEFAVVVEERSVETLFNLGLGAAAYRLATTDRLATTALATEKLQGADMTTRLVYQRSANAVAEYLAALQHENIRAILLKGISVAADYYTPPWSRVMGDVDVLVASKSVDRAANILQELGYIPDRREKLDRPHHHLPAVRHAQTGIILELHTGLFPPGTVPASLAMFSPSEWSQYTVESEFEGQRALRFTPEYQFAYSVAHWATERKWPVSVFPYTDAAYLARDPGFDWDRLMKWMRSDAWFAACVSLMIHCLQEMRLASPPASLQDALASSRAHFGDREFRAMLWLIRSIPLQGRDYTLGLINHRAARAAWRSMLARDGRGNLWVALRQVLQVRLAPFRGAVMRLLRMPIQALGLRNVTK